MRHTSSTPEAVPCCEVPYRFGKSAGTYITTGLSPESVQGGGTRVWTNMLARDPYQGIECQGSFGTVCA